MQSGCRSYPSNLVKMTVSSKFLSLRPVPADCWFSKQFSTVLEHSPSKSRPICDAWYPLRISTSEVTPARFHRWTVNHETPFPLFSCIILVVSANRLPAQGKPTLVQWCWLSVDKRGEYDVSMTIIPKRIAWHIVVERSFLYTFYSVPFEYNDVLMRGHISVVIEVACFHHLHVPVHPLTWAILTLTNDVHYSWLGRIGAG